MNSRHFHMALLLLCFVLGGSSCDLLLDDPQPDINDPRITRKLKSRLDQYKTTRTKKCIEDIIGDAEAHIDTLLPEIIDQLISDTTYFPQKPDRPDPVNKLVIDSNFQPVPLFNKVPSDTRVREDTLASPADSTSGSF